MKWEYNRIGKYWKKQLHHYWSTITDGWGVSSDPRFNYKIDTYMWKCFAFGRGFWYQIKAPNITINNDTLDGALSELFRYLYRDGGTPCYQRLEEELMRKNMWRKLGS